MRRKTHEEFINEAEIKNPALEILGTYIKQSIKIKCKCKTCNHTWDIFPSSILRGACCPKCSNMKRRTHEDYVKEIYDLVGDEYSVLGEFSRMNVNVMMRHNECGHEWEVSPASFIKLSTRCPKCAIKNRTSTDEIYKQRLSNINNYIINIEPYISSNKSIKHKCLKCGNIWNVNPGTILSGVGCGVCAERIIVRGINDLWTTHPHIAKLLKNPNDGYISSKSSRNKLVFVCENCGSEKAMLVRNVIHNGFSCPSCGDNVSRNNKILYNMFKQLGVICESERSFSWSQGKRYDFFIPSINCLCEAHGRQHYEDIYFGTHCHTFEDEIINDELKEKLAYDNDITHYIVIDCRAYDFDYIKNSILKSELSKMFDLSNIDWELVDKDSIKSYIKECAVLWNDGLSTGEIIKILPLSKTTVTKYLKKATLLNLCNYSVDERRIVPNHWTTPVICLTTNKVFNSIKEANEFCNSKTISITNCCSGRTKSAGKHPITNEPLRWQYYSDYLSQHPELSNDQNQQTPNTNNIQYQNILNQNCG